MVRITFFLYLIIILFFQDVNCQQSLSPEPKTINEIEFYVIKYQQEHNGTEYAKYLSKLGYAYWDAKQSDKALETFQRSIKANEDIGNTNAIRTLCTNIGLILSDKENYDQAITFFRKSLRINEKLGKKAELAGDYINIALALQNLKKYDESNITTQQALTLAQEASDIASIRICYTLFTDNYDKLGKSEESKQYAELAASLRSHMQKEEIKTFESRTKQAEAESAQKGVELESTKKEVLQISKEKQLAVALFVKEKELHELTDKEHASRERELKAHAQVKQTAIISLIIVIGLILVSLAFIFRQLNQKKKAFDKLEEQNNQIIEQKKEIEIQRDIATQQKKKITDSILYAKRIQTAVLPPLTSFDNILPEHFIFYSPRDIVSGDFYWVTDKEGVLIIAAADCTGHGVPGAFMSMLGVAYLNEIVNKIAVNRHIRSLHASEILNQLRDNVIKSLHQTGIIDESKDGMDIALCIVDFENNHLQYAGAHNPLYVIRKDELIHIEGDKMPIGYSKNQSASFTNHEMQLETNDLLYLFSDGYYDQFGGPKGMKMFSATFRKLLLEIHTKPLHEQKQVLEQKYFEWKGDREQIDDVLVIGFKITPLSLKKKVQIENYWAEKRILIAEDTDINYFLLVEALRPTKAQVFRAKNGLEAVEFCKSQEVDLVLMDIRMPEMDGFEATQLIRQFKSKLPIIAQTAQSDPGDMEKILQVGCNDYIAKPIDLKTFQNIIRKHLIL